MIILKHKFTNDILFKMLFVKYPHLLKKLVAVLLGISLDSIMDFIIRNAEIPPETYGDKFCRLDISMTVNGQRCDLEVQVDDEGDYPERSLFFIGRVNTLLHCPNLVVPELSSAGQLNLNMLHWR